MGEFDTGGIEFSIARLDKKQGNDIDVGVKQLYHCLFFYSFLLILTFLQMVFSIISAEKNNCQELVGDVNAWRYS